jgi:alanine-glyoxylate transaminase/serine-glyoxylate transaminase/serine-pyruvate transaminase
MGASPKSRLNLLSRHLEPNPNPFLQLNTPFSTERSASEEDETGNVKRRAKPTPPKPKPIPQTQTQENKSEPPPAPPVKMSSQPEHPALLIPGPIEFDDAVLQSMSHYR